MDEGPRERNFLLLHLLPKIRKKGRNLSLTNEEAGNSDFHNVGADVLLLSALSAQNFFLWMDAAYLERE